MKTEGNNTFQAVYRLTGQIPFGRVTTYGQIARLLGNPRLSRIVGCALNGAPEGLPCHRVVNRLGGLSDAFLPLGRDSQRLLLELAAILHSCGSFVNVRQHNQCTFDLIKGMDIFGLSSSEVLEVAFVAGSISNNLAVEENPDFSLLPNEEKLVISKLAAMFRMANALDKSHRAKLRDLKVSMEEDRVIFKAEASGNTLLERWSFRESAAFFTDVFGLSPELTVKLTMLS